MFTLLSSVTHETQVRTPWNTEESTNMQERDMVPQTMKHVICSSVATSNAARNVWFVSWSSMRFWINSAISGIPLLELLRRMNINSLKSCENLVVLHVQGNMTTEMQAQNLYQKGITLPWNKGTDKNNSSRKFWASSPPLKTSHLCIRFLMSNASAMKDCKALCWIIKVDPSSSDLILIHKLIHKLWSQYLGHGEWQLRLQTRILTSPFHCTRMKTKIICKLMSQSFATLEQLCIDIKVTIYVSRSK